MSADDENEENKKTKISTVPLISQIILGPIHRYRYYGSFPWKMFVHVLIVIMASVQ